MLTVAFLCLYLFELAVRINQMRTSLIIHHVATIGYTAYSVILSGTSASTFNVWVTTLGLIHAMFAMFEHPTFIALLCYRLFPKQSSKHLIIKKRTMYLAFIHFGTTKLISVSVNRERASSCNDNSKLEQIV
eukprot:Awhi_evm1s15422